MKILIIITKAGLCNRLQEILSYRDYALQNNYTKIYFLWINTTHCSGNIFEIIDDISKVKILSKNSNDNFEKFLINNVTNHECYNNISKNVYYLETLVEIKMVGGTGKHPDFTIINPNYIIFKPSIIDEVNEYIQKYLGNDYIAIHLRKQGNHLFIDFDLINKLIEQNDNKKIYLATDCKDLQDNYKNIENISYNTFINKKFENNRSNLKSAVFDILVCAKAKIFCGTPNKSPNVQSSYSNFIYGLRGVYSEALSTKYYNKHFIHSIN